MAVNQLTFKKKERAKKKQQKKQEKFEKRLLKKESNDKGKGLEDMLAYVDDFGNLTTVPPEERPPNQVRKNADVTTEAHDEFSYGKVSYYNVNGHYGFIRDNQTRQTIYFNDRLVGRPLDIDQKVKYKSVRTRQGEQISEVELL